MAVFTNGNYVFTSTPLSHGAKLAIDQPNYKLFITDDQGEIKDMLLPFNNNDCTELSRASFFTQSQDSIIFNASVSDTLIVFSKNDPNDYHAYYMDFGNNKMPNKQRNNLEQIYNYEYLDATPFFLNNYLIGTVNLPDNGDGTYIYNIKDNDIYLNSTSYSTNKYLLPPIGIYKNQIITSCDNYEVLYLWLINNGFTRAPEHIENAIKDGNPVLIMYSLKAQ